MTTSKQRFIKEYANWKISVLEDLIKNFPEKEVPNRAYISLIRCAVRRWEEGLITTDEVMKKIADY